MPFQKGEWHSVENEKFTLTFFRKNSVKSNVRMYAVFTKYFASESKWFVCPHCEMFKLQIMVLMENDDDNDYFLFFRHAINWKNY